VALRLGDPLKPAPQLGSSPRLARQGRQPHSARSAGISTPDTPKAPHARCTIAGGAPSEPWPDVVSETELEAQAAAHEVTFVSNAGAAHEIMTATGTVSEPAHRLRTEIVMEILARKRDGAGRR